ncbi:BppU family phage baseplate upper protein [Carnobacterium maltaromaticum]|uniref:BppU family phage baseplate upper protein n=1 Tax=Carnobacterium maltaromaticum TaxID=2751 RepID=UPI00026C82C4|nr:BppU family phage baseplate upper protein [Carnobacterium maltaromaticum]
MSNYDLKLSTTQPNHVEFMEFRQDDILSRTLNVAITSHDLPRDLTGYDVFLNSTLPSRNIARDKVTNFIDKVNGKFSYTLIDSFVQDTGRVATWFSIEKGGSTTQVGEVIDSTTNFSFSVVPGYRNCVKQGNYIWEFEELLRYVTGLANQSQVQLDKLINDVEGIQQQIDDMFALIASQGVLSADEVRQLLINFMNGQDIEVTVTSDFTGKVAGSNVENGNKIFDHNAATVQLPSAFTAEASQEGYNLIKLLDGKTYDARYTASTRIAQRSPHFDALWILEKNFSFIFKNASTTAGKVTIAKSKITKFQYNVWAKASGPTNTTCYHSLYNPTSTSWGTPTYTNGSLIQKSTISSASSYTPNYLNNDGLYYFVTYAEASNGTSASSVSIDYASIDLTVKFNISDFVATKAQYDALKKVVDDHVADTVKHITAAERTKWNAKQDVPVDSGWITAVTSGVTQDGAKPLQYRRIGNKMYFRGGGTFPTTAGATFLVIPVAYAPAGQAAYHDTIVRDSNPDHKCIIQVQSDGACRIITNSYAANPIFLDGFEYVIA